MHSRTGSLLKGPLTLISLVLSVFTAIKAEPVNVETAIKAASTQIQVMDLRYKEPSPLHSAYVIRGEYAKPLYDEMEEELLAYVFELEPHGFVVVTADDDLVPIVAYSEHGSFCWEEHPENILLNMLRQDLSLRLEALPLIEREIIESNHQHWEGLIEGNPLHLDPGDSWPEAGSTWTGGWVETAWHQGSPYNDSCPIDPETGERCVVGCTGTAMAQIVNYWQYPSSITFTIDDNYVTYTRGMEIYAPDASISDIDYNDGEPSDEMCAAISYACGVGAKMNYTSYGSSAGLDDAARSYLMHFNYIHAEFLYCEDQYTQDTVQFYRIMEENMKDSMPILLWVRSEETPAGHSIVCDGFRETSTGEEWHLNWGWGEYRQPFPNVWYRLPQGMPFGYSIVRGGIVNIEPPTRYVTEPIEQAQVLSCSPNPFRDYVRILFTLPEAGPARVDVYDLTGRCVRNLLNQTYAEGFQGVTWNGKDEEGEYVNPGVYFIRIDTRTSALSQKVVFYRLTPTIDTIW